MTGHDETAKTRQDRAYRPLHGRQPVSKPLRLSS